MFDKRSLVLVLALGVAPLLGCPKTPSDTDVTQDVTTLNPSQLFVDGVTLVQADPPDYQTAFDRFDAALTAKPDFAKAAYNAGWCAEKLGNMPKAEELYRKALQLDPGFANSMFALGSVLTREGKGVESVAVYRDYVDAHPDDLKARNSLMEALTAASMYDEALEQVHEVLRHDPKNVGAYRNLSRIYFAQDQFKMSQLCAEKAKTLAEGDPGIYNNIGVTYLVMNDEAGAIKEFKTAIKLDPDNVEANLNLGYVALHSGDYALAKDRFTAALQGNPGSIDGKLGLAVALRGVKDFDGAAKLYDEIIAADPSNEKAYFNAATLYEKYIKDYKKAAKLLQEYVDHANTGQIGPDHEVYARMERIKASQAKEEERQREEQRKKDAETARKKKQQADFNTLKDQVSKLSKVLKDYGECPAMVEAGATEMGSMVLEQAQMIVEAEEIDMATDVLGFFDELMPQIDAITPSCPAPGSTPAPTAPAPEGAAPDDAAPAADAPAGEAPAAATDEAAPTEPAPEASE